MAKIIKIKERNILENFAADLIVQKMESLLKEKKEINFAICGGRSVAGIFNLLKQKNVSWKKVHIFMVDERLVSITDNESNFKLAKESFIQELVDKKKIPEKNLHPFVYNANAKDLGLKAYENTLKKHDGYYDIVLVSSGEDGHMGALYPKHHSIKDENDFFIAMHDSPKPPKDRMSMSRKLFLKSKVAIALFLGDEKKEAFKKFRTLNTQYIDCPVKLIEEIEDSYAVTDIEE